MIRTRMPRFLAALGLALSVGGCAHDATSPGGQYRTVLRIAPILPSLHGTQGPAGIRSSTVDSVFIAVTNAQGDTIAKFGVSFPPGQDSVVIGVPVVLAQAVQTVNVTIELLSQGKVIARTVIAVEARVGSTDVTTGTLESAIWTQLASVPVQTPLAGRVSVSAVYRSAAGNQQVIAFGGSTTGGFVGETWSYANGQWQRVVTAASPAPRIGQAMAYDPARDRVVLFGGATAAGFVQETWEFDGTNWTQKAPATQPSARGFHSMTYDANCACVLLFGGHDGVNYLNDTWKYNGTTWTAVAVGTPPSKRAGHQIAYSTALSRTVLFGGLDVNLNPLNDTWTFNNATSAWTLVPAAGPVGRFGHGMVYDATRAKVLVFGGANVPPNADAFGDLWSFDGTTWTRLCSGSSQAPICSPAPVKRALMGMAFDAGKGVALVFGGLTNSTAASDTVGASLVGDTWEWNGATWTATGSASLAARSGHAMVFDSKRNVHIMYGGTPGDTLTWLYDGIAWRPVATAGPGVRTGASMAFDATRGVVVLFGGLRGGSALSDTWEFDGVKWAQKSGGPPARSDAAMIYDAGRQKVVLFGGAGANGKLADTWEYNGTAWTQVTTTTAPAARSGHVMAYDATRAKTVLFGGLGTVDLGDTWTYNGTAWTQLSTATSQPARHGSAMAFDVGRGASVLFGGTAGTTQKSDIWRFDGTDWRQLLPAASPAARSGAAMSYDAKGFFVYLFGGASGGVAQADSWIFQ